MPTLHIRYDGRFFYKTLLKTHVTMTKKVSKNKHLNIPKIKLFPAMNNIDCAPASSKCDVSL
jgi:hypothetical protein